MQSTNTLLMIRPANFRVNEETAANNFFQKHPGEEVQAAAVKEFDFMVAGLRAKGIYVVVVEDTPQPEKPDAVSPNNWVSFHPGGPIFLFPMYAQNRRLERRQEVLDIVSEKFGERKVVNISRDELEGKFLEGTGSMVLDHINKRIFACRSPRTNDELVRDFGRSIGYRPVLFDATDQAGKIVYHTNVMVSIGTKFAVVCPDAVFGYGERDRIRGALSRFGRELIEISIEQMHSFAANILEVRNEEQKKFIIMSETARESLEKDQLVKLERYGEVLAFPLNTIEMSGGSARCMVAEIFGK